MEQVEKERKLKVHVMMEKKKTLTKEGSSASILPARKKPVVAKNKLNSTENREK
jgi:hypothetical protein